MLPPPWHRPCTSTSALQLTQLALSLNILIRLNLFSVYLSIILNSQSHILIHTKMPKWYELLFLLGLTLNALLTVLSTHDHLSTVPDEFSLQKVVAWVFWGGNAAFTCIAAFLITIGVFVNSTKKKKVNVEADGNRSIVRDEIGATGTSSAVERGDGKRRRPAGYTYVDEEAEEISIPFIPSVSTQPPSALQFQPPARERTRSPISQLSPQEQHQKTLRNAISIIDNEYEEKLHALEVMEKPEHVTMFLALDAGELRDKWLARKIEVFTFRQLRRYNLDAVE